MTISYNKKTSKQIIYIKGEQWFDVQAKESRRQFFTWIARCLESFMSIPGIKEFAGMDVGFSNCWSVGIDTASFTSPVTKAARYIYQPHAPLFNKILFSVCD